MPTVFAGRGYRMFFYSDEVSPREPMHVHITRGNTTAKFWIEPELHLAGGGRFNRVELNEIEQLIMERIDDIRSRWNAHFRS